MDHALSTTLPQKVIKLSFKEKTLQNAMRKLFAVVSWQVKFSKNIDLEKTFSIDVESTKWNLVFSAMIDAYDLKYRIVEKKIIEIYE